jgi:hypothetical protein
MTKYVQYVGASDSRELTAADFKKAGVEGRKTTFNKNQSITVEDDVADALTSSELFAGEFKEVEEDKATADHLTEEDLVGPDVQSGTDRP